MYSRRLVICYKQFATCKLAKSHRLLKKTFNNFTKSRVLKMLLVLVLLFNPKLILQLFLRSVGVGI